MPLRRPDGSLTPSYQFAGFPLRTGKSAVNAWLPFQSSTELPAAHATHLPPSGRTFLCWAADFDQLRLSAGRLKAASAASASATRLDILRRRDLASIFSNSRPIPCSINRVLMSETKRVADERPCPDARRSRKEKCRDLCDTVDNGGSALSASRIKSLRGGWRFGQPAQRRGRGAIGPEYVSHDYL